jgi:hypothetical protein
LGTSGIFRRATKTLGSRIRAKFVQRRIDLQVAHRKFLLIDSLRQPLESVIFITEGKIHQGDIRTRTVGVLSGDGGRDGTPR